MATWQEIEKDAPEFAEKVRGRFEAGRHKTMATLRKDGSPRISASELQFEDGEVTFGMMGDSLKLADVRRDPRIAVHSPSIDPPENEADWHGDAKLSGRAVEVPPGPDAEEGSGAFRIDVTEVALTYLGGTPPDHLVIESWHEGTGWRRRTRK
ncbi:pyridoxamine 5'-phosphate oxidase family protein [Actinophytocola oryzae]|uniref:Pyridoxamine 5'-phosphate oxidase n=1 Tax=Actinophytocola oryzae TaxID=502181 RepID=A0A4R7V2C3_9PSEU|nr:pyridoxamine 5'-phosphate oxidase family protein [Actinophytocola oryzae]TDV42712.1 pyridoxamine 5'-phosphate oxidase [Actinophytocola oryzae]